MTPFPIRHFISSLIFFSPLFWMRSTANPFAWPMVEITATALLLFLIARKKCLVVPNKNLLVPILILALWCACSLLWTLNFYATWTGLYKIIFFLVALVLFLSEPDEWAKALNLSAVSLSVLASAVWILLPFFRSWVTHPNLFSGFLALGGTLSVGNFLISNGFKQRVFFFCSLLIGITLFLTASLGPLLGWAAGCLVQTVFYRHQSRGEERRKATLLVSLMTGLMILSLLPLKNNPFHHIWSRKMTGSFSTERIQIWKDSARLFFHKPLTGSGLGTYRDAYPEFKSIANLRNAPYAHNELIHFVCEMGIIGLIILLWILSRYMIQAGNFKNFWEASGLWGPVALAAILHSGVDFNLRYPPILILFLFSISRMMPKRTYALDAPRKYRIATALCAVIGILFLLPGSAATIFFTSNPDLNSRSRSAKTASTLDPFNSFYLSQTGRMRDLLIAIDLEPRNVWYRRKAARFFLNEWSKTKEERHFRSAIEQYLKILKAAPNVSQFQFEYETILKMREEG